MFASFAGLCFSLDSWSAQCAPLPVPSGTLTKVVTSHTLPGTNIAPENRPSQKEITSSNHQFSGGMLVSGSVCPNLFSRQALIVYREHLCPKKCCKTVIESCGVQVWVLHGALIDTITIQYYYCMSVHLTFAYVTLLPFCFPGPSRYLNEAE